MSTNALIPTLFGIIGLIAAAIIYQRIRRYPTGDAKVAEIGDQIHLGAMVFMRREYTMLAWFCLVLIVMLWFFLGYKTALSFIAGAVALRRGGPHRHAHRHPGERAHHGCGPQRGARRSARGGVLRRLDHGPCGRVARPARTRHALPLLRRRSGDRTHDPRLRDGRIERCPLLEGRGRHLHQERRRRRGSRRQGRGRHSRGRPPQPRGHRRQRGRQRGRRCGHGVGHLRVLLRLDDRLHRDRFHHGHRRDGPARGTSRPHVPAPRPRLDRPGLLSHRDCARSRLRLPRARQGASHRDDRLGGHLHPARVRRHPMGGRQLQDLARGALRRDRRDRHRPRHRVLHLERTGGEDRARRRDGAPPP